MVEPLVYVAFFVFAALTLGSALMVVTARNLLHGALFLVLAFFSVAGLYVLLEAEFLAAVQVLIYVGAVAILFLFALMLTRRVTGEGVRQSNTQVVPSLLAAVVFFGMLFPVLALAKWPMSELPPAPDAIMMLGEGFVTNYALPFELMGVILLVALIGAIIVARDT